MDKIRVLLADDQILFVESLRRVISARAEDIEVAAVAYDGRRAVELADELRPDIVLLDIKMPELDGVQATKIIHDRHPDIKIMILTTFDDDEFVFEALTKGAKGYLLKNIPPEELIVTLRALNVGAAQISPDIAVKLVNSQFRNDRSSQSGRHPSWFSELPEREQDLLILLARGYSNKEIGDRLHLAEQTVKNYLSVIYEKILVTNRAGAIRQVIESGVNLNS